MNMTENRINVQITQEQVGKGLSLFKEVEATFPGFPGFPGLIAYSRTAPVHGAL
jgi:hypothetical protein